MLCSDAECVTRGKSAKDKGNAGDRRQSHDLEDGLCVFHGTRAPRSSSGSPCIAPATDCRWEVQVPTGTPTTRAPGLTTIGCVAAISSRRVSEGSSRAMPPNSSAWDLLRLSCTPSRATCSWRYDATLAMAVTSSALSSGRMTTISCVCV